MHHLFKLLDASDNKPVTIDFRMKIPELSNTARVLTKTAKILVKDNVFTASKICSYAFRHGYTLHAWRQHSQNYREQLANTVHKAQLEFNKTLDLPKVEAEKTRLSIAQTEVMMKQAEALVKMAEVIKQLESESTLFNVLKSWFYSLTKK